MTREFIIGLDLGTTSVKAVVFNVNGKVITETEKMITSHYPQQGWVEQNPVEIEQYAVQAIRDAIDEAKIEKHKLLTIGISAAMHSLICVDENGEPLSQALIWSDGRSSEQAEKLKETNGFELYARTGLPNHPMSPLSKLLWMKEVEYEPYLKANYFLSIKEYILQKWFGLCVIDYSMAAATGLFNANTFQWDDEILELAGVTKEQLSKIVPPTEVLTGINKDVAKNMGISNDMPIVIGAADGQLANLGIGAILPGEVAITAGTSGAIRQFTKGFRISDKQETFSYAFTEDYSIIGGPTNNGGIALQWLKELLNYQGSFYEFTAEAEQVAPGADGLIFLPYINGERAPLWNQHAKGNFFGMSITHKKEHFVRAVLEGITFNLYQIGQALEELAGEPEKIFVNGGLSRSSLWLQMLADVFGKEVYVSESHHSAAWAAAWTGLVALGKADSFADIKKNVLMGEAVKPNMENHKIYSKIFNKYEMLANDISKYF
ncbi:gluconokinase [Metabacillus sediminilitoris]|uniref:Gluconate kinase n=1 Tax=Metabacillus sediminilitoris TaxID=2567941 RepID=A0A4S4BNL9_9BACI|nr:gluconokinase [Metabacillus sediminilitoris]QGQ45099.1 gluconate kinase [Metabacillus sediminilitoris]THF76466.1 gluconate kinase [Metabacillus sediminilitoris]